MTTIAGLAAVLADPSRATMLEALLDGEPHPIGALARRARITAATASSHLARLAAADLVVVEPRGRHRLVRLASPEVAEVLERLGALATGTGTTSIDKLRFARTCYDHLAGVLGIAIVTRLADRGWLYRTSDNLEPAQALLDWLARHGQPVSADSRRPLSRACLDWTEREPHVAGRVGAAIARLARTERWVAPIRDSRALRLTERGRAALARELDVRFVTSTRGR